MYKLSWLMLAASCTLPLILSAAESENSFISLSEDSNSKEDVGEKNYPPTSPIPMSSFHIATLKAWDEAWQRAENHLSELERAKKQRIECEKGVRKEQHEEQIVFYEMMYRENPLSLPSKPTLLQRLAIERLCTRNGHVRHYK